MKLSLKLRHLVPHIYSVWFVKRTEFTKFGHPHLHYFNFWCSKLMWDDSYSQLGEWTPVHRRNRRGDLLTLSPISLLNTFYKYTKPDKKINGSYQDKIGHIFLCQMTMISNILRRIFAAMLLWTQSLHWQIIKFFKQDRSYVKNCLTVFYKLINPLCLLISATELVG